MPSIDSEGRESNSDALAASFSDQEVAVLKLARMFGEPSGIHLDIGFGLAHRAAEIREAGLTYVAIGAPGDVSRNLRDRSFDVFDTDLDRLDEVAASLARVAELGSVAAITALDVVDSISSPTRFLHELRLFSLAEQNCPLVLSAVNIAHSDVAIKLLMGRWDEIDDRRRTAERIHHFTDANLSSLLTSSGWHTVGEDDLVAITSAQHFPQDHIALMDTTTLGEYLTHQRRRVDSFADVTHFVRVVLPGKVMEHKDDSHQKDAHPFLTVVLRTQGTRGALIPDALLCLAGQTEQDFNIIVAAHDVDPADLLPLQTTLEMYQPLFAHTIQLHRHEGGLRGAPLNSAVRRAGGEYIAFFDDDDLLFANWVAAFKAAARENPGRLIRTVATMQSVEVADWAGERGALPVSWFKKFPSDFNLIEHLRENQSPFMSVAFPNSFFNDLGEWFDESLAVVEDWDCILRAAFTCGVANTTEVTAIYRRWKTGSSSFTIESQARWQLTAAQVINKLDQSPHAFPPGTISHLVELGSQVERSKDLKRQLRRKTREARKLRASLTKLRSSKIWKVSSPVRRARSGMRRPRADASSSRKD